MVMDTAMYQAMSELSDKISLMAGIMFACMLICTLSLAVIAIAMCVRRFH